ncbi:recombinase family protein [Novacetimonas hansenii]|jgi:DNA invertase Pin-like site-specific DNA recombinase|uniref:DNA-invertase n=2 Tax=Novacetimonas hansenii TaxID=436 RepID=A0ABQ0SIX3_NOVHA|nr:recombinase family protein [Novacetimonas hansenii]EFG85949.1 invertase-like protein [Novacetimonas hansenii ATCC 23769]GAN82815.1 DNA recombinase/resolvase [Novacetimonas hansenii JCM 7643]GBQ52587.1 site-specific recombinase [Novacetimonas hansenii NRIC 0243]GEC65157.1 DNA-invertase [Novacetimonas hansenii]
MIYGYARVSTRDQSTDMQVSRLLEAGIPKERIFMDVISGATEDRPQLNSLLSLLNKGDVLTVWKVDRLGRRTAHLARLLEEFDQKGITVRSLTEGVDTSDRSSRVSYLLMSVIAQNERETINERIRSGIDHAQKYGTKTGRPIGRPKASSAKVQHALDLLASGKSYRHASSIAGVSLATLVRRVQAMQQKNQFTRQTSIFETLKQEAS